MEPSFAVPAVMPLLPDKSPNAEAVTPMVIGKYPVMVSPDTPPALIRKTERLFLRTILFTEMY
jgi:hypothetical protein